MPARKPQPSLGRPGGMVHDERARMFRELELVVLDRDIETPGGRIPRGTHGTVLQVFDSGGAYQIEFEGPFDVPETVPASALNAASGGKAGPVARAP